MKPEERPGMDLVCQGFREWNSWALKCKSLAQPVSNQDRRCEPFEYRCVCNSMIDESIEKSSFCVPGTYPKHSSLGFGICRTTCLLLPSPPSF